jgi:hypothetical protein
MPRTIYAAHFWPATRDRDDPDQTPHVRLVVFDQSDPDYRTVHNIAEMPYTPSVGRYMFRAFLEEIWEDCSFDWLQLGAGRWRIGSRKSPEAIAEAIVQHVMEIRL